MLVHHLSTSAMDLVAKHGEFYPLAAVIDRSLGLAAFIVEEGDQTDAAAMIESLTAGLQRGAMRGDYIATGLCMDVSYRDPGAEERDALSIRLDHVGGASHLVLFPYARTSTGVRLGEPRVTQGAHLIFPVC